MTNFGFLCSWDRDRLPINLFLRSCLDRIDTISTSISHKTSFSQLGRAFLRIPLLSRGWRSVRFLLDIYSCPLPDFSLDKFA